MKVKAILALFLLYLLALPLFQTQNTNALTLNNNTITTTQSTFAKTTLPEDVVTKFLENDIFNYDPEGDCVRPSSIADNANDCVPATGDQVTWIGDSYSVDAQPYIESALPGVDLGQGSGSESYIHCSKSISRSTPDTNKDNCAQGGTSGLEIAKSISSSGNMRKNLVFALGTNDAIDKNSAASYIDELVSTVGSGTNIILTTARTEGNDDYNGLNSAIRDAANKYSNVSVADWATSDKYSADYYQTDPEHPGNGDGYKNWVDTITSSLPDDCNNAGTLPGNNAQEKIWNQLVNANIPGVSDNAAVLAGILANIQAESEFNPFAFGSGGYYGLFQDHDVNDNGELKKRIDAAIGEDSQKYFDNEGADAPQDVIDKAITATVDYFAEVIQNKGTAGYNEPLFIANLDKPTNKNGAEGAASYAELFLVTFERATFQDLGIETPIEDSGVIDVIHNMYGSGASNLYQGAASRRQNAIDIYNSLGKAAQVSRNSSVSVVGSSIIAQTTSDLSIINIMNDSSSTYYHPTFAAIGSTLRFFALNESGAGGGAGSSTTTPSSSSSSSNNSDCGKLAQLRQDMWNSASQTDRERFNNVVMNEQQSVSAVEAYMNQVIAKYGNNGTLHDWLENMCPRYIAGGSERCATTQAISSDAQGWIDEALSGSNNIRYAVGNATGGMSPGSGDDIGAGKIVCVWDGEKCLDIDYSVNDGLGRCSDYTTLQGNSAECWGMEGAAGWNEELGITNCGPEGSGSSGSSSSSGGQTPCVSGGGGSGGSNDCVETPSEDEFPNYNQHDPQWADVELTDGCTVGDCACGATAYAEIITALTGQEVTPLDVAKMTADTPYWENRADMVEIDKKVGEKYGLEVKGIDVGDTADIISKIEQYAKDGWMLHLSGGSGDRGSIASTPGGGHYISVLDYRENNGTKEVLVTYFSELNGESHYDGNSWISLDDLSGLGIWENRPISATRKTGNSNTSGGNSSTSSSGGSNSSSSSDPCATTNIDCTDIKNSNIGQNGLNEEQAALFLARYAANEGNVTKNYLDSENYWADGTSGVGAGIGRNQCVALSMFFVNNFTKQSLGRPDYSGNYLNSFSGGEIVNSSDPPVFSVFQVPGVHVGIVVGKTSDGTPITINNNGHSTDHNAIGGYDMSKFNANDFLNGGTGTQAVSYGTFTNAGFTTEGILDVDVDKLIKYLCTGQL